MYYSFRQKHKNASLMDLPSSERPRDKLIACGAKSLSNAELLAVLFSSNKYTGSVLDTASRVLALEKGSIAAFSSYQPEEFLSVSGMGTVNACRLCAAIELGKRIASSPSDERVKLDSPKAVSDLFMEELRHLKTENFVCALLNVKGELIMKDYISSGGLSSSFAHPREVFRNAIKKGAYSMILLHNHPSGDPTPSSEDFSTTKTLKESGELLGIRIMDHIIIGDGVYYSFLENNRL